MAVTMGQLTAQILTDTNRDSQTLDPNFGEDIPLYPAAIQRAILTAIKYMESRFFWMFRTSATIEISQGTNFVDLPSDFNNLDFAQYNIGSVIYTRKTGFINVTFEDLFNYYNSANDCGIPRRYAIKSDIENGQIVNRFYIYPNVQASLPNPQAFTVWYYYKDAVYPTVDGSLNNDTTSIWFNDATVDLVRMKAMERFYHDTLQAPDLAANYTQFVTQFENNLSMKNQNKQLYNMLSV